MTDTTPPAENEQAPEDEQTPYMPPQGPADQDAAGRLRIWPAVVIVALQLAAMLLPRFFTDNGMIVFMSLMWAPMIGGVLLLVWWVFFSRLPWKTRLYGLLGFVAVGGVSFPVLHPSMRLGFLLYALPTATSLTVVWLALRGQPRLALTASAVGFFFWTGVRLDGVDGNMAVEMSPRWTPTREEEFLAERAQAPAEPEVSVADTVEAGPGDWTEFRGIRRDGRVENAQINTDWGTDGPPELWRRRVGPGWSSFCVVGERIFTQEQRGDVEVVVCYHAETGAELWEHQDDARFDEVVGGPGPRATPTFVNGFLYTTGASGLINCLNPLTGEAVWTRDLVADTGATIPTWGFSSSPLITDDLAIVYTGAGNGKSVIAYDITTGEPRWNGGSGGASYSSCHHATLLETPQILTLSEAGLESLDPETGQQLWEHEWLVKGAARIVQPAIIGTDAVVLGTGYGVGSRRISLSHEDSWATKEVWTSIALKPYFNDFVVEGSNAFGFDGAIFCCIDLETGERRWKRGRYGNGQVILLAEQQLLVVLGEKGQLALLKADPEKHSELARFKALEGKTWNHPVIAGGRLFVRNGVEAACYDVSVPQTGEVAGSETTPETSDSE